MSKRRLAAEIILIVYALVVIAIGSVLWSRYMPSIVKLPLGAICIVALFIWAVRELRKDRE